MDDKFDTSLIKKALLIRQVEEKFLELFSQGKLNGTVHTSVGQEFSALAFAGQIEKTDFIFSNHRCHGHYLEFTGDVEGLLAELLGRKTGTCGGVGSSQHLCNKNFYSNGIQGGIVPVAAGHALANKLKGNNAIGVVFIGDGTLGEGVLYETMNIISKWEIPLLIVCENNLYAQSTHFTTNLSGEILKRPEAFAIKTYKSNTWEVSKLLADAKNSIDFVRKNGKPVFHLVDTYRLNAHSKGDDDRDLDEITKYKAKDVINIFSTTQKELYENYFAENKILIENLVEKIETDEELKLTEYFSPKIELQNTAWKALTPINSRQVYLLNAFFKTQMENDKSLVFIGEDILSPYGGAFKVAKDLSTKFPERVFSSPISEAAITGIGNGLALAAMRPCIEIMFGDFILLTLDQLINHASKFNHMYNGKTNCPLVIRTPMGGGRGYGPTHSQTLDKFLIGIDDIKTIALNTFINPQEVYKSIFEKEQNPIIVLENKTDYGKKIFSKKIKNFNYYKNDKAYPEVKISPKKAKPTLTIVTYGGISNLVADNLISIFLETDFIPEVIILTQISPLDLTVILESVTQTGKLVTIEEGSVVGGIGSEIISAVTEKVKSKIQSFRIGALAVPIPSVKSLENKVLPNIERIISEIKSLRN